MEKHRGYQDMIMVLIGGAVEDILDDSLLLMIVCIDFNMLLQIR
jgi:hypothetical protein